MEAALEAALADLDSWSRDPESPSGYMPHYFNDWTPRTPVAALRFYATGRRYVFMIDEEGWCRLFMDKETLHAFDEHCRPFKSRESYPLFDVVTFLPEEEHDWEYRTIREAAMIVLTLDCLRCKSPRASCISRLDHYKLRTSSASQLPTH